MNPWYRIRDELVRRMFGFSPFELEDEVRRLKLLVDRLRDEHAVEVERLRAEIRRLGGDSTAATAAPQRDTSEGNGRSNGNGRKRLPIV